MSDDEIAQIFDDFIEKYDKPYKDDKDERLNRYYTFRANLMSIDKYNGWNPMAVFGITYKADWTEAERDKVRGLKSSSLAKASGGAMTSLEIMQNEFPDQTVMKMGKQGPDTVKLEAAKRSKLVAALQEDKHSIGGSKMDTGAFPWITEDDCAACKMFPTFAKYNALTIPTDFDWRALGAVGAVTNQMYCGSCWSFSTAQDIEGTHFLATGELVALAEQQLVACDTTNDGCDGGWPFRAMQYIHDWGGMLYNKDYPYRGICAWDACDERSGDRDAMTPTCDIGVLTNETKAGHVNAIGGYQMVAMGAEYEELAAVALVKNGPLSIAFNSDGMDYYLHGVTGCSDSLTGDINAGCISAYEYCNPASIDHAVLIVGFGEETIDDVTIPYWVIKNSWSDAWGEDGYFRIVKGSNQCGVVSFVVHSVVKEA